MAEFAASYDPRRFRTTVPYYARYRLGYPDALIAQVIALVGLRHGDVVLDLGCGPGTLAIPFARAGMAVTAVDPEPEMLAACEAAAREAGVAIAVRQGSSFEMPPDLEPCRLVTMGRSFHWMDREATLLTLDGLVTADGAVVHFDDEHPRTAENAWRGVLEEIANRFGRGAAPHVAERKSEGYRTHVSYLLNSPFCRLERYGVVVRREIGIDDIVGLAFSLSTTAPQKLGDRREAFEQELRGSLAQLSPSGRFTEIAEMSALVARRP